jgi:K+-transporting ATPase KdpF subunit
MKARKFIPTLFFSVVPIQKNAEVSTGPVSYLIGGIIALLILGYLIYTLLHPEKF